MPILRENSEATAQGDWVGRRSAAGQHCSELYSGGRCERSVRNTQSGGEHGLADHQPNSSGLGGSCFGEYYFDFYSLFC